MSQYPPPPQPNFYQPGGYGAPMPQPRTSGLAVTSLVLGLIGCIPFITSLLAVILGLAGIGATRKPGVSGRGLAIAGLILGILGLIGWSGAGAMMGWAYVQTKPARIVAKQFLADLSNGKVNEAQAVCTPDVSRASLDNIASTMKNWGTLTDTTFTSFNANAQAGIGTDVTVAGAAVFGTTTKAVQIRLVKQGDTFKVIGFQIQ